MLGSTQGAVPVFIWCRVAREAARHLLYTTANSRAMNGAGEAKGFVDRVKSFFKKSWHEREHI